MAKYIYGKNPLKELLTNDQKRIVKVFITSNEIEIIQQLKKCNISYSIVDKKNLFNLIKNNKHQGIVIEIYDYQYSTLEQLIKKSKTEKYPLILLLDQIQDPQNFGAILRTCDAVNITGVIILDRRQVDLNATVAKTSAGAINYVSVVKVNNLSNAINRLKEVGFWVIASKLENNKYVKPKDYNIPLVLIVGSENKGVSQKLLSNSDYNIKIPMKGQVQSLNVSVASALMLYEIRNNQNIWEV